MGDRVGVDPPADALRQPLRACSIQELLPDFLKDWVRQATDISVGLIDFLLSTEDDEGVRQFLRAQRQELVSELRELTRPE